MCSTDCYLHACLFSGRSLATLRFRPGLPIAAVHCIANKKRGSTIQPWFIYWHAFPPSPSATTSSALPSVNFHNHVAKASIALPGFHRYLGTLPIPLHRHESAHSAIMDNLHTDGQFMEVDINYKELVGLFSQVRVNLKTLPY